MHVTIVCARGMHGIKPECRRQIWQMQERWERMIAGGQQTYLSDSPDRIASFACILLSRHTPQPHTLYNVHVQYFTSTIEMRPVTILANMEIYLFCNKSSTAHTKMEDGKEELIVQWQPQKRIFLKVCAINFALSPPMQSCCEKKQSLIYILALKILVGKSSALKRLLWHHIQKAAYDHENTFWNWKSPINPQLGFFPPTFNDGLAVEKIDQW